MKTYMSAGHLGLGSVIIRTRVGTSLLERQLSVVACAIKTVIAESNGYAHVRSCSSGSRLIFDRPLANFSIRGLVIDDSVQAFEP